VAAFQREKNAWITAYKIVILIKTLFLNEKRFQFVTKQRLHHPIHLVDVTIVITAV